MATQNLMSSYLPAGGDLTAIACPCCGRAEWTYLEDEIHLLKSDASDADLALARDPGGSDTATIRAAAFLCEHGRFIRLQAA
jgi:hypothetical protein